MSGSFAALFGRLSQHLAEHPEQGLELTLANVAGYRCQRGGSCCRNPWKVDVDEAYYLAWHKKLQAFAGLDRPVMMPYADPVLAQGAHAYILKQPGSHTCLFQAEDHSCRIHSELGEEALPQLCRSFPREVPSVGERLRHISLSSACEHAAAMLDEQADLLFSMVPTAKLRAPETLPTQEPELALNQHCRLRLPDFLPWLGWILDQIFDVARSPQQALHDCADLLSSAQSQPETDLKSWLASGWQISPQASDPRPALQLFLDNSPFSEALSRFVQRQQRLRLPWPVLDLRSQQRIARFERQYLLRRLLSLELLAAGPQSQSQSQSQSLSLSQYLWLLSYGLLAVRVLLFYRLAEQKSTVSLPDLVWCLNRWELMGMQHPHWLRQLGLTGWDDVACLRGLQQLSTPLA